MPLYIISTPIGNLSDISERSKKTLEKVDLLLAEDTRKTVQLFDCFNLSLPKITSYNDRNKHQKIAEIINLLKKGQAVGLVSNAGTPLVSDPGYQLVRRAIEEGIQIISIPGPTALIQALLVSGFPPTRFCFLGFLTKSKKKKADIFNQLHENRQIIPTVIFYESPKRLISTLEIIQENLGNKSVVICRELTKKYEDKTRGTIIQVAAKLKKKKKIRGEVTVVLDLNS